MHAMKAYVRVDIQVHSFVNSALGTRGLLHSPEMFLRWKERRGPLKMNLVWPQNRP